MNANIPLPNQPPNGQNASDTSMVNDSFKVYCTNRLPVDADPVVVTSVALDGNILCAEYHIFMMDAQNSFYSQRTESRQMAFGSIGINIDAQFMLDDARICAENKLNCELSERFLRTAESAYIISGYKLIESDPRLLLRIHLTGRYQTKLAALRRASVSGELIRFLQSIKNLPVFSRQEDFV